MKIRNVLLGLSLLIVPPVMADESKITKGYNTMDSMGCMLVRDCKEDVELSLIHI